jgi:tetratricopeptide (TPR) repeat protein
MAIIKFPLHLILLCVWVSLTAAAAQGQAEKREPADAQSHPASIVQAQTLLGAGKANEAIGILKSIARSDLNRLQVDHLLGLAHYQKGDYTRAAEYLSLTIKEANNASRQYQQAVELLGMSYYFLGRIKEGIPYLEQVKTWAPGNVEMAYVLGNSYIRTQNPEGSRECFARMFAIPPGTASAYLINAQMMIRQQVETMAEKELQKALELDPKLPQANFLLAELAIYGAQIERGIELLKNEIAINPAFGMAYYRLGEAYTRNLKWDEAIAPLQKSIWLSPFFSGPYIVLGKVYLKKGDLPNAENILKRALRMDPNNFTGHHLLAQVLQQANRVEEARKEFELADRLRAESEK